MRQVLKFHSFHAKENLHLKIQNASLYFSLHFTLSLSLSTHPNSQSATLQIKLRFSLSYDFGHESWFRFRVSRLYSATLIKIKIRFSILLLTRLRLKVEILSTLISLSYKLVFSKCSSFSLLSSLSSDFKISFFFFFF